MRRFIPLALSSLALAAASGAPALAQTSPVPVVEAGHTVLTVNAEGKVMRAPDLAVFSAGVTTQGKTAQEALAANSRAMSQVVASLKRSGIAERDIQTSNLSISPIYSDPDRDAQIQARATGTPYIPPPPEERLAKIIGYQANNSVSVRQRRLDEYGKVIDTLVASGANKVQGPSFQMDKPEPALDEARVQAMSTARQRADLYARAAGLRVVRILSINESGGYYAPQTVAFARAADAAPAPSAPIQPGELQMTTNVNVMFELAP